MQELEDKLQRRLGVKNVVCVSSGTAAIMLALRALEVDKEVYVSPNSFVATVSAPVFMGIKPIFVDKDETYKGPALITHLYGQPNLVDGVSPVIYDASHAFTTSHGGKSILAYGDVSVISFNAVKVFQTVEGGAVVTDNDVLADKVRWLRNHGFATRYTFHGAGINCKMSEFHAAMGLCSLELVDKVRARLDQIIAKYNEALGYNHVGVTYYPVYYPSEASVVNAIAVFEENGIYPRRYFYPPLNRVFGGRSCPVFEDEMSRVLCIPLYYHLKDKEAEQIIKLVKETI